MAAGMGTGMGRVTETGTARGRGSPTVGDMVDDEDDEEEDDVGGTLIVAAAASAAGTSDRTWDRSCCWTRDRGTWTAPSPTGTGNGATPVPVPEPAPVGRA